MSTIFGSLELAARSLYAQQFGLEVAQRNIANANTPGYTRQRTVFSPADPLGSALNGAGVLSVSIESFRDRFIDYRISQELQQQGRYNASSDALRQVEVLLNEQNGQGLQDAISAFFNSFDSLANAPEDMPLRLQVLSRAEELAADVRRLYDRIEKVQALQDRSVEDTLKEINDITGKLAALNGAAGTSQSAAEFGRLDERQRLLDQLAERIDISYFETESGSLTVTTQQGSLLVLGEESHALQGNTSQAGGRLQVELDGVNITSKIASGKLGGLLNTRDVTIAGYQDDLDDLAAALIERVNSQHRQGSDYNGADGGNFFQPFTPSVAGSNAGAALSLAVAITDPKQVAAGRQGAGPGSNANALLLAGIQDEKILSSGSLTLNQHYGSLIYAVGAHLQAADDGLNDQKFLLVQLQNQRDSFSGVNMDEEAVNIIRYQRAYEASARLVRVWDELAGEVIGILGG